MSEARNRNREESKPFGLNGIVGASAVEHVLLSGAVRGCDSRSSPWSLPLSKTRRRLRGE